MSLKPLQINFYTRVGCPNCRQAEDLAVRYKLPHTSYVIDKHVTRDEVKAKFPGVTNLPIVEINGEFIGHGPEFVRWVAITDFNEYQLSEKTE